MGSGLVVQTQQESGTPSRAPSDAGEEVTSPKSAAGDGESPDPKKKSSSKAKAPRKGTSKKAKDKAEKEPEDEETLKILKKWLYQDDVKEMQHSRLVFGEKRQNKNVLTSKLQKRHETQAAKATAAGIKNYDVREEGKQERRLGNGERVSFKNIVKIQRQREDRITKLQDHIRQCIDMNAGGRGGKKRDASSASSRQLDEDSMKSSRKPAKKGKCRERNMPYGGMRPNDLLYSRINVRPGSTDVHKDQHDRDRLHMDDYASKKARRLYEIQDVQDELEELTEDEAELEDPAKKEIWRIKRDIKVSFKKTKQPPPSKLSYYKIGRIIGRGAYGKVNIAVQKLAQKIVAVKSVNKKLK